MLPARRLAEIAAAWNLTQLEAAKRLQPAGAIYHSIDEQDMRRILAHPATMIGSDGLPWDKHPHPRLWGAFPRVLGRYCRDEKLFSLPQAIHKMTTMPARRFGLALRGAIAENYWADVVLFDADAIGDAATFADPIRPAHGIAARLGQRHAVVHCSGTYRKPRRPLSSPRRNGVAPMMQMIIFEHVGQPMIDPHSIFLLLSALGAVIGIILLVTVLKLNPFLSLLLASSCLAIVSGMPMADVIHSFETGVGRHPRAHRHRRRARHHAGQNDGGVRRSGRYRAYAHPRLRRKADSVGHDVHRPHRRPARILRSRIRTAHSHRLHCRAPNRHPVDSRSRYRWLPRSLSITALFPRIPPRCSR